MKQREFKMAALKFWPGRDMELNYGSKIILGRVRRIMSLSMF